MLSWCFVSWYLVECTKLFNPRNPSWFLLVCSLFCTNPNIKRFTTVWLLNLDMSHLTKIIFMIQYNNCKFKRRLNPTNYFCPLNLNYWKTNYFCPLNFNFFFLSLNYWKIFSFFILIFVSKLLQKLFSKFRDEKWTFYS